VVNKLKVYSWNVNGIRAVWNKELFQKFIKDHDPDILCLQETKAMPHQSPVDLPQYHEYWNSAEKAGYSGTAIFSKEKPLEVRNGFSEDVQKSFDFIDKFGDPTKEGRVISARFKDFWVVTVYTPNSKEKLERLAGASSCGKRIFVTLGLPTLETTINSDHGTIFSSV
jgi:exodeoxyribonuclease-3